MVRGPPLGASLGSDLRAQHDMETFKMELARSVGCEFSKKLNFKRRYQFEEVATVCTECSKFPDIRFFLASVWILPTKCNLECDSHLGSLENMLDDSSTLQTF